MNTITIYPNNSVTIDGVSAAWEKKDFRDHKIPMERMRSSSLSEEEAEIRFDRGNKYVVFPTSWHVAKEKLGKGKPIRKRTCANPACRKSFMPRHPLQKACSTICSGVVNNTMSHRRSMSRKKRRFSFQSFPGRGLIDQTQPEPYKRSRAA
jgi:hypothetical protein